MRDAAGVKLSVMMFLQFFIWGAWYVTAPNYLGTIGFGAADFGWTYSVGPIAGMIAPLFVGMIADRFFAAQRVLGVMHLAGGGIMFFATTLMQQGADPSAINWAFFGYMLTYYPTLALTNTVAMRNMTDSEKQFPIIRVFGTIGWIVAGLALSWTSLETKIGMFYVTSGAAFALGVYSFLLPNTPPVGGEANMRQLFGLDAIALLKDPAYLIFMVSSVLICIPLAFYYQIASRIVEMSQLPIGQTMSYGQMSEIFFMLIMPVFFARLGVKWMLFVGMLAWVIRYGLFALGAPDEVRWMIITGIVVHGICYDFFFVTGQIYTDKKAPEEIRGQAQGLLVMLTLGLGMFVGAKAAGHIEGMYTTDESKTYNKQVVAIGEDIDAEKKALESATGDEKAEIETRIEELSATKATARLNELRSIDWKPLWTWPCMFAGAILLLFTFAFHEKRDFAVEAADGETAAGATCRMCGTALSPGAVSCSNCGEPVAASDDSADANSEA